MPADPYETLEQMLRDCEARESRLTDWERRFVDSVTLQFDRGRALSSKQRETLERIWDRVTAKG